MFGDLTNKNILITGASSGIGRATAIFLAGLGARIALVSRSQSQLKKVLKELGGNDHKIFVADISITQSIHELMDEVYDNFGILDGMVHCAGIQHTIPLQALNENTYDNIFNTNLKSAFFLLKFFRRKGKFNSIGSSVVLISSTAASTGQAGISEYSASKIGLQGLARSSAVELSRQKIRVNCISPGVVETNMLEAFRAELTDDQYSKIVRRHPLGTGNTDDIVGPIAFLLSDYSRWITGTNLNVDGGYTIA